MVELKFSHIEKAHKPHTSVDKYWFTINEGCKELHFYTFNDVSIGNFPIKPHFSVSVPEDLIQIGTVALSNKEKIIRIVKEQRNKIKQPNSFAVGV